MIVFHGSPLYFGKFENNKIGNTRLFNPVHGHYFSEDMYTALQYRLKYYTYNKPALAFLQDVTQNITSYLYVCEVPDKAELLDLSMPIQSAPESVKAAVHSICTDGIFHSFYIKVRKNNTIGEFIRHYKGYCQIKAIHSMLPNIFRGFKGVYGDSYGYLSDQPEIVIFDAKDIQIKQCFIITPVHSNIRVNPEYHSIDLVSVLFKRFGEYYYAHGTDYKAGGVIVFKTNEDCPEIVDEVQTFDELNQNPFVIAYIVSKPIIDFSVVEGNVNSLNYNPRKGTQPKKASIYTVGDIKAILNYSMEVYAPVKSKITNPAEFAEYKRQVDKYKYLRQLNPFTYNTAMDIWAIPKANTLLLQQAKTPYFNLRHITPGEAKGMLEFAQAQKDKL